MAEEDGLIIRKRMAVALGWRDIWEVAGTLLGLPPKEGPPVGPGRLWSARWLEYEYYLPHWDLSLDACLRDALPVLRERGWRVAGIFEDDQNVWHIELLHRTRGGYWHRWSDTPARAFCDAFSELVDMEGRGGPQPELEDAAREPEAMIDDARGNRESPGL